MSDNIIELKRLINEHFKKIENLNSDHQQYGAGPFATPVLKLAAAIAAYVNPNAPTKAYPTALTKANPIALTKANPAALTNNMVNPMSNDDMVGKNSFINIPNHNKDNNIDYENLLVNDARTKAFAAAGTGTAIIATALARAKYNNDITSSDNTTYNPPDGTTSSDDITSPDTTYKPPDDTTSPDKITNYTDLTTLSNIDNLRYLIKIHFKNLTNII